MPSAILHGMMGRSLILVTALIFALMPAVLGGGTSMFEGFFDEADCLLRGFCSTFYDQVRPAQRTGQQRKRSSGLLPELGLPSRSGLLKNMKPENFTQNLEKECPYEKMERVYRTIDGTCNHPFNLGASNTPLARFLPSQYEDGKQVPRAYAKDGSFLPSPRRVSKIIHPDVHSVTRFSIMVMAWGQMMDHDVVSTPMPIEDTRRTTRCCTEDRTRPLADADPECFPIMFEEDKYFVGSCMEFVRSMPIRDSNDNVMLPREHMNVVTSFVDASIVYGSTEERLAELRDGTTHLLKVTEEDYLPDNGKDDCIKRNERDVCFLAGDDRVNEHLGLTIIHTILVRLHNRIAHILRYMRPIYPDEAVFQRARQIVIAITQKIMYADWLPIVLGAEHVKRVGLAVGPGVPRPEYNSHLDPSCTTEFATAVFRFGHTLIPRTIPIGNTKPLLRDLFFKPFMIVNQVEACVHGLTAGIELEGRMQMPDAFMVEEVTDHLFETEEGIRKGFDLIALNIQRGRDHGMPSYNEFREYCGFHRIESFNDEALGISQKAMAAVYRHPDDIELFTGGMVEPIKYGGLLGETFNCLMSQIFFNLKYGDRFFYETRGQKGNLHDEELAEIQKVTLAQVLCQTTGIQQIQANAFMVPSKDNPLVSCDTLVKNGINLKTFVKYW